LNKDNEKKNAIKNELEKFAKYYDKDVFVAASRRIRHVSRSADELEPTERLLHTPAMARTTL